MLLIYLKYQMTYPVTLRHSLNFRKQEIIDGTFEIFEGSSDGDLLGMSYFVDNVVGTLD